MPNAEPIKEKEQQPKRRRLRPILLTDYSVRKVAPAGFEAILDVFVGSGDVRERIEQDLDTSPTARLVLAIQDLDPSDASKSAFRTHSPSGEQYYTGATERTGDAQTVPSRSRPNEVRPKPGPVDSVVSCLYETYSTTGKEAALDFVYAVFHPLVIKDREFDRASRILSQIDAAVLPSGILIGLLMTTYAHKTALSNRASFFARAKARIEQLPDGAELLPYLDDLE